MAKRTNKSIHDESQTRRELLAKNVKMVTDMPPGTDCPYPIRILAFFEMIRPYHVVIRI